MQKRTRGHLESCICKWPREDSSPCPYWKWDFFFLRYTVYDSDCLLLLSQWISTLRKQGCGMKILLFPTPRAGVQWLGRGSWGGDGGGRGNDEQKAWPAAEPGYPQPILLFFITYPGISGIPSLRTSQCHLVYAHSISDLRFFAL